MLKHWGRIWYAIGIIGTIVFSAIFFITRVPGNPITGRGAPINQSGTIVEAMQLTFIGIAGVILAFESLRKRYAKKEVQSNR